ncbi:MAG TPA: 2-amino-4-hydroxy-6-hydroxymethyldihydropteridine diphosphokinase [Candidatus Acidoferrales bacterium]|nr:2-amino-4-hydroxy-6-hydroxymethyldihydropteridine diphosphokinase [Candidatus Acidoferrales bacterium]
MKTVYLSLGSNVGDREGHLAAAIAALGVRGIRVTRQSSIYSTEPVDFETQNWFLNCVVEAETDLMPRQLLRAIRQIENEIGRRRLVRSGPRVIDLDILLCGSSIIRTLELEVPHPRMAERRFVLVPLAEIAPMARHPVKNKTVTELLAETPDRSGVRPWKPEPGRKVNESNSLKRST